MKSFSLLVPLIAATYASAHGYVASVTIDGKVFKGVPPDGNQPTDVQSVIRQIKEISPVKGANNPDLNCGLSAVPSALVADANPGSKIDVGWADLGGANVRVFSHSNPFI
jgi:Auxiliary Activity family 9 (formerly GH61)